MWDIKFFFAVNICFGLVLLLFAGVKAQESRAFLNPLNDKSVDVFFVVDETNSHMNVLQLGQMKTWLYNMVIDLNPVGSKPSYGMYFYGSKSTVNVVVPFGTPSVATVKTCLDQKQYATAQANRSTLSSALGIVHSNCVSNCRKNVPRVTVVLSSAPDSSAEITIRQLERAHGMIVIVVGMGSSTSTAVLNQLASHPRQFYAIQLRSFDDLPHAASHICSTVSDVPRLLEVNDAVSITSIMNGIYHTVQVNTYQYTSQNDAIVMFASNCASCSVFGSLSEPNPNIDNSEQNTDRRSFYAYNGYPNSKYYFRIPKDTERIFISFRGNAMNYVTIVSDVFSLPTMLTASTTNLRRADSLASIG